MVVNHTSIVGAKQTHLLDTLLKRNVQVVKVFAPEHGFRGNADAGETVKNGKDSRTGTPIVSLYGDNKKPSAAQLKDIDVILFDIQDVGARFYTYISTMYYVMEACAENKKEMIVLDRPNPCDYVDGPILKPGYKSFVGMLPIPVLHGCTIGELAQMINGEEWIANKKNPCSLKVIPMVGGNMENLIHFPSNRHPTSRTTSLSDCTPHSVLLKPPVSAWDEEQLFLSRYWAHLIRNTEVLLLLPAPYPVLTKIRCTKVSPVMGKTSGM